ncbi:MerR-family transcriptional regulator [Candidatus Scalindua japonica]|uniref:MerR-family transcriptional regulator n=1 Tax=Candidatus Scalindua japonica TaxID=1284222 RepID=A0A286U0E9_9BACT|nr:hypothetical protein [Candidatus Scalindua japonica]GAX61615.1 MerR-family transcriptional regulator [Candidatus Scalindua japonica]
MAKKKIVSTTETIKDGIPIVLTDVVEKLGLQTEPGDKILFTRISQSAFMATIEKPVTKEIEKDDNTIYTGEISSAFIVEELYKYNREKKLSIKTEESKSLIAFAKIGIKTFYMIVEAHYHISDRMIRRYISRGLIPPPERHGKNAYYEELKTNVFSYLNVIDTFKKRYNLSLDDIGVIINNYRNQIVELDFILSGIEIEYNKPRRTSPNYIWIRKRFLERIQAKTENLEKLNIKALEREIKRKKS